MFRLTTIYYSKVDGKAWHYLNFLWAAKSSGTRLDCEGIVQAVINALALRWLDVWDMERLALEEGEKHHLELVD